MLVSEEMLTHHIILYNSYQFNFQVPKSSRLSRQLQDRASILLIITALFFYTTGEALPNGCSFTRSNDDGLCLTSGSDCCTSKSKRASLDQKCGSFQFVPPPSLKGAYYLNPLGPYFYIMNYNVILLWKQMTSAGFCSNYRLVVEVRSSGYCSHSIVQIRKFLINVAVSAVAYNAPSALN